MNVMSDETTNPEQSPAASIPRRPSNRVVLLALTSSFTINVAFWGTLIYSVWETVGLYKGIVGCTVFIVVMAGVHLIGYRLWQRQFVQDQGPDFVRILALHQDLFASASHCLHPGSIDVGFGTDHVRSRDRHRSLLARL